MRVRSLRGSFSGGTAASIMNVMKEVAATPALRKELADPYSLCPPGYKPNVRQPVVAFGPELTRSLEAAYDKPAAVTFYDYQEVEGIIIPALWRLRNWNEADGILGRPIGEGALTRLELAYPKPTDFSRPPDAGQ